MQLLQEVYNVSKFPTNQKLKNYTLQYLMRNIIVVANCFAILPVDGVISKDPNNLTFTWRSFKTIYTVFVIILLVAYFIIIIIYVIAVEISFDFEVVVWNLRCLTGLILFLRLAQKWPILVRHWSTIDTEMLDYGPMPRLVLRFRIVPWIFLLSGIGEHLTFVYGAVRAVLLKKQQNDDFFKMYFLNLYDAFFYFFEYALWKAVFIQFLAVFATFFWQFCDLFIILLSSALAERFRQINLKIKSHKTLSESQWRAVRTHYNKLSLLCKDLNSAMSELILLSLFGNVYFLSQSVFQVLKPKSTVETIYLWYSIVFVLFHFLSVSLYASWVHEESTMAISIISSLPVKQLCHEVDRLLQQMAESDVGIYGGGLFKVTRPVVLNVVKIIITIQLIFIQFQAKFSSKLD